MSKFMSEAILKFFCHATRIKFLKCIIKANFQLLEYQKIRSI